MLKVYYRKTEIFGMPQLISLIIIIIIKEKKYICTLHLPKHDMNKRAKMALVRSPEFLRRP